MITGVVVTYAKFPINRDGHGLGLAIVKSITVLHRAKVSAENNERGGGNI